MKVLVIIGITVVIAITLGLVWVNKQARTLPPGPGMAQFQAASESLNSKGSKALGNNPKAIELADRMRNIMEQMRSRFFSGNSTTPIAVYCQLNEKNCAFLIYVPELYKYSSKSEQQLAEMAWISAQPLFRHLNERPARLAIGLRDGIPYNVVWTGKVTDDPLRDADEKYTGTNCRVKLYPFFLQD